MYLRQCMIGRAGAVVCLLLSSFGQAGEYYHRHTVHTSLQQSAALSPGPDLTCQHWSQTARW